MKVTVGFDSLSGLSAKVLGTVSVLVLLIAAAPPGPASALPVTAAKRSSGRSCSNPTGYSHFSWSRLRVRGVSCSVAEGVIHAPMQMTGANRGWNSSCRQVKTLHGVPNWFNDTRISDCVYRHRKAGKLLWFTVRSSSY